MGPALRDQLLVAYTTQAVSQPNATLVDHIRSLEQQATEANTAECDKTYRGERCQRDADHPGDCAFLIVF